VQSREAVSSAFAANFTTAFDACGSLHGAFAHVLDDPDRSWRKEFEVSAGFPTG